DISGLIEEAAAAAKQMDGPTSIVLLSDGGATLGELDGDVLRGRVARAIEGSNISVHTVSVGHAPADDAMRGIARAGAGHFMRMTPDDDPGLSVAELANRVEQPMLTDVKIDVLAGNVTGLSPQGTL